MFEPFMENLSRWHKILSMICEVKKDKAYFEILGFFGSGLSRRRW